MTSKIYKAGTKEIIIMELLPDSKGNNLYHYVKDYAVVREIFKIIPDKINDVNDDDRTPLLEFLYNYKHKLLKRPLNNSNKWSITNQFIKHGADIYFQNKNKNGSINCFTPKMKEKYI